MLRAKWLVLVCLLIAAQGYGDEFFMKGVTAFWDGPKIHQMKDLGANSVHLNMAWKKVEPEILDASLTVEAVNGNPDLISNYPVDWTAADNLINPMADNGFAIVPWIGHGVTNNLPLINGEKATPDRLGNEYYLGCIYRYARATVRRYRDRIHHWMIEGELNEAQLTSLFGWRHGGAWAGEAFLTELISTLHDAVRAEDPDAEIVIVFHTDIHEGIHHDTRPGVNGAMLAGPYHWTEWLEKWEPYLDIVGIDCYSNYYTADPIYGADVGDRVATARGIVPDKPVIVFETAYPTAAPGVILPDPVSFTEEKQAQYVGDAINSAIDNGADGFFYYALQSKGMVGGYTDVDLDALRSLGPSFRNGDAEMLTDFLISNLAYAQERLPGVLMKVEEGWGLVRDDGSKRPGFYVLQNIFSSIPEPPSLSDIPDQTIKEGGTFEYIHLDHHISDPDNADSEITWTYTGNNHSIVSISDDRVATIAIPNDEWNGSETLTFIATDSDGLTASDIIILAVEAVNDPPVVSDIPDHAVEEGNTFTSFSLDDYVSDVDDADSEITWTFSSNTDFGITIDDRHFATVTVMEPAWIGSETITFTATDPGGLSSGDNATFTVNPMPTLIGDVNRDGSVRPNDATITLRIAAQLMIPDDYQKWAADMNNDGRVRANDATLILRESAGLAAPGAGIAAGVGRQITVTLSEARGVAGESITVPVWIDSSDALASGTLCINYDGSVLRVTGVLSNSDALLAHNTTEPGLLRIAFAGAGALGIRTLAEIQFDILKDDVMPLTFMDTEFYGPDTLPLTTQHIDAESRSWAIPPAHSALLQNFPNPFNPDTWIPYQLREGSNVEIWIYGSSGNLVRELPLGYKSAGLYVSQDRAAHWGGRNETGESVASGVYFILLKAGEYQQIRRTVLVR